MKRSKWIIILANLLLLLVYFNYSIFSKERMLKGGQLVLLKLAPQDPRSLMQGDYMSLRYDISTELDFSRMPKRGYCVVRLDEHGVAGSKRFQKERSPLAEGEYLIGYTAPDAWNVNIGAESFFFQEGQAEKYSKAKYGAVKVDNKGNSLLVGLYDDQYRMIR